MPQDVNSQFARALQEFRDAKARAIRYASQLHELANQIESAVGSSDDDLPLIFQDLPDFHLAEQAIKACRLARAQLHDLHPKLPPDSAYLAGGPLKLD